MKMRFGQFVILALCFIPSACMQKAEVPESEPTVPSTPESEELPTASPSRIVGRLREPESTHYHEVRQGETISKIAETYRVDVDAIVSENGLSSPDHIEPGQLLAIPGIPEQEQRQP